LKEEFGSSPQNILAGIGPSICAENYEVGKDVIDAFEKIFPDYPEIFSRRQGDKAHLDLWLTNKIWLIEQGVPEENIEIAGLCTFRNPNVFYSARYFKNKTGRFASAIVLK
jgi:copper oxidase (laccase) domain-containing protein